jgi:hypothetical protein
LALASQAEGTSQANAALVVLLKKKLKANIVCFIQGDDSKMGDHCQLLAEQATCGTSCLNNKHADDVRRIPKE